MDRLNKKVSGIWLSPLYVWQTTRASQIGIKRYRRRFLGSLIPLHNAVSAASQWRSNERMMVYFKLMMVKCLSMIVKWVYDHTLISPSLTSISPSLTSILPSLAHLTIIEKLHRLQCRIMLCNVTMAQLVQCIS